MKHRSALADGFLGQLARRLDPTEPVLQRRQPSRFEPVAPWGGEAAFDTVAAAPQAPPATRPRADAPTVPAPPTGRATAAAATAASAHVATPMVHGADAPLRHLAAPILQADARADPGRAAAPPAPEHRRAAEAIGPRHEHLTRETHVVVERVVNEAGTPPARAAATPAAATPSPPATRPPPPPGAAANGPARATRPVPIDDSIRAAAVAPARRAADAAAVPHPAAPRPAPATVAAAAAGTARRAAAPSLAPAAAPAPLPPIEVTIGRVEIRAVAPAAAPARPVRAGGPRLSLDDYLRQRGGGGPR